MSETPFSSWIARSPAGRRELGKFYSCQRFKQPRVIGEQKQLNRSKGSVDVSKGALAKVAFCLIVCWRPLTDATFLSQVRSFFFFPSEIHTSFPRSWWFGLWRTHSPTEACFMSKCLIEIFKFLFQVDPQSWFQFDVILKRKFFNIWVAKELVYWIDDCKTLMGKIWTWWETVGTDCCLQGNTHLRGKDFFCHSEKLNVTH